MNFVSRRLTFQQQVRAFNNIPRDVSVPIINSLHSTTQQQHNSTWQLDREDAPHYSADNIDLVSSFDNNNNDEATPRVETCSFQRQRIRLLPDIFFQVQLMHDLSTHRGNDLNLQDDVLQCIKTHVITHNVDFKTIQILPQKTLIKYLTRHYQLEFLQPQLHAVPLSD